MIRDLFEIRVRVFDLIRDEISQLGIPVLPVERFNKIQLDKYNYFIGRFCSEIINLKFMEWTDEQWVEFIHRDSIDATPLEVPLDSLIGEIISWYPTIPNTSTI